MLTPAHRGPPSWPPTRAPVAAQDARAPLQQERAPAEQGDQSSALAELDRLAVLTAAFVRDHVPDRAGETIWLLPFVTDTGMATRLGHRLQSSVHLRLLRGYGATRIRVVERRPLPSPAAMEPARRLPAGAASARHAVEVEIQPFRDTFAGRAARVPFPAP